MPRGGWGNMDALSVASPAKHGYRHTPTHTPSLTHTPSHAPSPPLSALQFADSARGIVDAVKGMSVAVPREYQVAEMDAGVSACWQDCAAALEGAGASVHLQSLPTTVDAVAAYYVIAPAEASSNLSRYDSVRYGHRADRDAAAAVATRRGAGEADFHDLVTASRSAGFGEEVQRRILAGTYALSAEAYGAYYGQAVRVRVAVRADFARLFESGVDVVLVPSTPTPAYPMEHLTGAAGSGGGDSGDDPAAPDDAEFLNDLMTIPANLAGGVLLQPRLSHLLSLAPVLCAQACPPSPCPRAACRPRGATCRAACS